MRNKCGEFYCYPTESEINEVSSVVTQLAAMKEFASQGKKTWKPGKHRQTPLVEKLELGENKATRVCSKVTERRKLYKDKNPEILRDSLKCLATY